MTTWPQTAVTAPAPRLRPAAHARVAGVAKRILVLGAGFGGLELSTILSNELGEDADVTLIDKGGAFVFGYSKLDVMFGRETSEAVRLPYSDFAKPGVRFVRETITAIDREERRVSTDGGEYEADILVVALGADYDMDATPGLAEGGNEFYSVAGAERCAMSPGVHRGARRGRRLWRPLQVPAGAERGRAAPPRPPLRARRTRRLQDHPLDAATEPGASVAADVRALLEAFAERSIELCRCARRLA